MHTGNLIVTPKGKLLFVDEGGFRGRIRGAAFTKPLLRFGWMKKENQRNAFWKGYKKYYNNEFFTKEYEDFVSIIYAIKTIRLAENLLLSSFFLI